MTAAQPRHRRRAGVPGHPHRPPGAAAARGARGAAARHPELCRGLRVDLGVPRRQRFRRHGARPHRVLLPLRLPPGRSRPCAGSTPPSRRWPAPSAASPWNTFWSVTARQLRPAAAAGALLVALYALSDFGAASLLRYDTFTRVIYASYRSSFDRTPAAVLSLLLVVITVAITVGEARARPGQRARAGRRGSVAPPPPGAARRRCGGRRPARCGGRGRRPRLPDRLAGLLVRDRSLRGHRRPPPAQQRSQHLLVLAAGSDRQHRPRHPRRGARGALPRAAHVVHRACLVRRARPARHRGRAGPGVLRGPGGASPSTSARPCS